MATSTLVEKPKLQSNGCCKSQAARNNRLPEASPNDDAQMDRILENMHSRPWQQLVKKIATMPEIRRGKVLNIRRQLTEGTYEVACRLDRTIDRVLEAFTA